MAATATTPRPKWTEKISRSGYFFGAVMLHLVVFFLFATWVIFPAFQSPPEQTVPVPTTAVSTPTTAIVSQAPSADFNVPMPIITPTVSPVNVEEKMQQKVVVKPDQMSPERLQAIRQTETKNWGRDASNILESNGDPRNVIAKFPVYLASYADGDWYTNTEFENNDRAEGKIIAGSLINLVLKINEWSHGKITGTVQDRPLDIGGPDLMNKRPPFIFFTGHKDFTLLPQEIKNLQDYLQVGGAIWGDNALAGRGSRFDVAFRREMKKVIPDIDKNFEPVAETSDIFTKSWYAMSKLPQGMNYYNEPLEQINIDGKLAILYTPNDYSDMFSMEILPGDTVMGFTYRTKTDIHHTNKMMWDNHQLYFRNYVLPSCLACDQLGMNVVGHLLVRFDKEMLLSSP
jgi:hypothetical protein